MKISKIILFILSFILSFLLFTKGVFAVSFNGSTEFKLPGVVISDNIADKTFAWKQLWDFNDKNKINNITSINCIGKVSEHDCGVYLINVTKLFRLDMSWNWDYRDYKFAEIYLLRDKNWNIKSNSSISFKANLERDEKWKAKSIEFYYEFQWGKKTIHVFDVSQKCGTENEKICVIGLNSFFTYSSKGTTNWVYWTYSDFTIYNSATNKIIMNRIHKDKSEWIGVGWFQSLFQYIDKYNGGYWMRIVDIDDGDIIYSMRENLSSKNKYKIIRYKSKNGFWYFSNFEDFSMSDSYYYDKNVFIPYISGSRENLLYLGQFSKFSFDHSNEIIPYINAYMWGDNYDNGYKNSIFQSLQDVFNFKWWVFTENNGTSTDPSNFPSTSKCETLDISCHVGDFVSRIFSWFSNFFSWLLDKILWFFGLSLDFIKSIVTGISDFTKNAFENIKNFSISKNNSFDITFSCDNLGNFRYSSDVKTMPTIFQIIFDLFKNFAQVLSLAFPIIPDNGQSICTYGGMKTILYRNENTIFDYFLVLFSSFWTFLFLLKFAKND